MITQAGPKCDVCDNYILLDTSINPFSLQGSEEVLHCHDRCKPLVYECMNKQDFTVLPDGRLRRTYEKQLEESK